MPAMIQPMSRISSAPMIWGIAARNVLRAFVIDRKIASPQSVTVSMVISRCRPWAVVVPSGSADGARGVSHVRAVHDGQGCCRRVASAAVSRRQPPDTAGMTWTVSLGATGGRQVGRLAGDEHVDVRPQARARLDESVAQPGDLAHRARRAPRRRRRPGTSCRRSTPGNSASSERGSRTVATGAVTVSRGRRLRPPRSRAGRP